MTLADTATRILNQLRRLVQDIQQSDFTRSSSTLSGSTIGQHVRHTLEFFLCLQAGCRNGVVNYDSRAHDKSMEDDKHVALETLNAIIGFVSCLEQNTNLSLEAAYGSDSDKFICIHTNTLRELMYNIEHAVHHMAIIKIGVRDIAPYLALDPDFGVAASTMRSRLADSQVTRPLS